MMSIKLVCEGRTLIVEADSFTITEENFEVDGFCRQISAHQGALDNCWWVGTAPYVVDSNRVFASAYIMNSTGKTVETISAPVFSHPVSSSQAQTIPSNRSASLSR